MLHEIRTERPRYLGWNFVELGEANEVLQHIIDIVDNNYPNNKFIIISSHNIINLLKLNNQTLRSRFALSDREKNVSNLRWNC